MNTISPWLIPTPLGTLQVEFSSAGLVSIAPAEDREGAATNHPWYGITRRAIEAVLAGRAPSELPPLDLQGSPFQRQVWKALRQLAPGDRVSYGELARQLGRAGSARAVGSACGANPLPLLIPCHRVVRNDGTLGGFAWGLRWKEALLNAESAAQVEQP